MCSTNSRQHNHYASQYTHSHTLEQLSDIIARRARTHKSGRPTDKSARIEPRTIRSLCRLLRNRIRHRVPDPFTNSISQKGSHKPSHAVHSALAFTTEECAFRRYRNARARHDRYACVRLAHLNDRQHLARAHKNARMLAGTERERGRPGTTCVNHIVSVAHARCWRVQFSGTVNRWLPQCHLRPE